MNNNSALTRKMAISTVLLPALLLLVPPARADSPRPTQEKSLLQQESFFPIAVWLQSPQNAGRYKAAGINIFVGLWRGPTAEQLASLKKAGLHLVCRQTPFALTNAANDIILAWMHDDEPDNAQSLGKGKGYGPPITPEVIQQDYQKLRAADPTRPVLLNLGQGVAWDNYIGRGTRRNHPEDYAEYIKGADIVSFDIYPVVHDAPEIQGKLEYVAKGVKRLREWGANGKTVWNCIECTHISNPERKANPEQIRAEVWMSLIHGSRGLIYFVHQFKPSFTEAALLDDPENLAAVTQINAQIQSLARVLNQPDSPVKISASTTGEGPSVASMVKQLDGFTYLFTVAMENKAGEVAFKPAPFLKMEPLRSLVSLVPLWQRIGLFPIISALMVYTFTGSNRNPHIEDEAPGNCRFQFLRRVSFLARERRGAN